MKTPAELEALRQTLRELNGEELSFVAPDYFRCSEGECCNLATICDECQQDQDFQREGEYEEQEEQSLEEHENYLKGNMVNSLKTAIKTGKDHKGLISILEAIIEEYDQ